MTVVKADWLGANELDPKEPGPEQYAPPDRRAPANVSDGDHIAFLRRQPHEAYPANEPAENLNTLIQGVAGASMDEIDRVMRELESVRDLLRNEGERVSREITGYASLSHASMTAMKVIADSIKQWKDRPDKAK